MKELSVFIDESGDFGEVAKYPAYYLVTFVFHDQTDSIENQVAKLESDIKQGGYDIEYIHTGPLIRREEVFAKYSIDERRKLLYKMLNLHREFFAGYDRIIVYYDNGQAELSSILNAVFSVQFSNVEFRKAEPQKYRLLQAADFICSMELLNIKRLEKRLSRSEEKFFYRQQELKKVFIKSIERMKLK